MKIIIELDNVADDKGQKGNYVRLTEQIASVIVDAANSYTGWYKVTKTDAEQKLCTAGVNAGIRYALKHPDKCKQLLEVINNG